MIKGVILRRLSTSSSLVLVILYFLPTFLLLAACSLGESRLLADTTCEPPCWEGIIPGDTQEEDALARLREVPGIVRSSIRSVTVDEDRSYVSWIFRGARESGRLILRSGTVISIKLGTEGSVDFGGLVAHLGEPELVSAIVGWADGRWLRVSLLYPTKGIAATHFDAFFPSRVDSVQVQESMPIEELIYFDPYLYDELLTSWGIIRQDYESIQQSFTPWVGFSPLPYLDLTSR